MTQDKIDSYTRELHFILKAGGDPNDMNEQARETMLNFLEDLGRDEYGKQTYRYADLKRAFAAIPR